MLVPPAGPETQDALVLQDVLCLHCTIGSQADTTCMLSRSLFLYFLIALEAYFKDNWVNYIRNLSTLSKGPKMSTKERILAPEMNVHLIHLNFP